MRWLLAQGFGFSALADAPVTRLCNLSAATCCAFGGTKPSGSLMVLARQTGQTRPQRFRLSGLYHTSPSYYAADHHFTTSRPWQAGNRASPANTLTHETRLLSWLVRLGLFLVSARFGSLSPPAGPLVYIRRSALGVHTMKPLGA